MVLNNSEYNAAYYGDVKESGGLRHDAGYSNYLEIIKEKAYLKRSEDVLNKVSGKILELGCGVGTYAKLAREKGLDWTAIDFSEWCKRHEETQIIKAEAESFLLSQADNSFDYIVSFAFIECLKDDDLRVMQIQMDRVGIKQIHSTYKNPNPLYYNTSVKSRIPEALNVVG